MARLLRTLLRSRTPDHVRISMIIKLSHHSLVQWQHPLGATFEDIAVQGPAIGLQLFAGSEQLGVVGHVEHRRERDSPRVTVPVTFAH